MSPIINPRIVVLYNDVENEIERRERYEYGLVIFDTEKEEDII